MYTWSFRHPCGHGARAPLFTATAARTGGVRVRRVVTRRRRGGPALAARRAATGTAETRRAFAVQSGGGLQTRTHPPTGTGAKLCFGSRADPPRSHPKATNGVWWIRRHPTGKRARTARACVYIYRIHIYIYNRYAHRRSSSRALRPNGTISALLQRGGTLAYSQGYFRVLTVVLERYSH
jgi:hypothetical protein